MKFKMLTQDHFRFEDQRGSIEGTLKHVYHYMRDEYNIAFKEVEDAIEHMLRRNCETATFGVNGTFICTLPKDPKQSYKEKALIEMEAIKNVKDELFREYTKSPKSQEVTLIQLRLLSLLTALDVENVISQLKNKLH